MSIKFSDVIPSPRPLSLSSSVENNAKSSPVINTDIKKASDTTSPSSDVLLSNRNQLLSNGTYIQARRDLHNDLKPIIDKIEIMYGATKSDNKEIPSFRAFIEKNVDDIPKFDEILNNSVNEIKKGNFSFSHLIDMNKFFGILNNIDKKASASDDLNNFKKHFTDLKTQWDKIYNSTDNRTKFVHHLLKGLDLIENLDSSIKKLSQSPVNQNADLALFSERIISVARNIRDVAGNVTAYAQANNFDEQNLHKRALELPDCFQDFTKTLSEIAQNPAVQNNKEYIDLLTNVYKKSSNIMQFLMPEIKKGIDNYQNNIPTIPVGKYNMAYSDNLKPTENKPTQNILQQNQVPSSVVTPMMQQSTNMPLNTKQMLDFINQKSNNPNTLISPYSTRNIAHSPTSDDKELRALQSLWDWADHSVHMKNKINAVNEIGQTMEEIAMSGSGRPSPEMVALAKRGGRLNSLKDLMKEVPKINKATQELEKSALEAQHAYMTGVNQIATQKLKLDIDGAHMQSEQQKIYQKGLEKLGLDSLEISTNMARNYTKIMGLFNEILMARIDITWDNIKRLTRGFKF